MSDARDSEGVLGLGVFDDGYYEFQVYLCRFDDDLEAWVRADVCSEVSV